MDRFKSNLQYLVPLLKRLGILLLIFSIIRFIFLQYNADIFPELSFGSATLLFIYGLRFDLAALIYINALFILLSLFPFAIREKPFYLQIQKFVFVLFNSIAFAFELIDVGFYKYAFRRSIGSDLSLFSNTAEMIPGFLIQYWPLLICYLLFIFLLLFLFKKTTDSRAVSGIRERFQIGLFLAGISLAFIGARGGIQLRPIMPITAFQYVSDNQLAPVVSNTSLNLIFSSQQNFLEEPDYFSEDNLPAHFSTERNYHRGGEMKQKNVCIIVLESFGKEHIGYFNKDNQVTPFLDSLINESYYLTSSYANGIRSTQGIVAITTSIPSMMQAPFMFSAYQSNRIDGLAKLLGEKGYTSAFFHGANPGSMEFDRFSNIAGFQSYYDRIIFQNDAEYDGKWGIWDEPFFQYTAETLNKTKKPFLSVLFSLTSHHPYSVPDWFEEQHPNEKPQLRSMRYTDFALQRFFEKAERMSWFDNTLFIITADHIGQSSNPLTYTRTGLFEVPIIIYDPSGELKGKHQGIAQQIDIMPTVLDLLNYPEPFYAFGKSMLDTVSLDYSYNYINDAYHILDKEYILLFNGTHSHNLYHYPSDPGQKKNLIKNPPIDFEDMENKLKAIIQHHHNDMIKNELYLNNE